MTRAGAMRQGDDAPTAGHGDVRSGPSRLMEAVVEGANLQAAWRRVRQHTGSPGSDGMTTAARLPSVRGHGVPMRGARLAGTYRPPPGRRGEMPTQAGGLRPLGMPTTRARGLQQAIRQGRQPRFDPTVSAHRDGCRPGCRARHAMAKAQRSVEEGRRDVVDADLEPCWVAESLATLPNSGTDGMVRTAARSVTRSRLSCSRRGGSPCSRPTSIAPLWYTAIPPPFEAPGPEQIRREIPQVRRDARLCARRGRRLVQRVDGTAQPGYQACQPDRRGRVLHAVGRRVRLPRGVVERPGGRQVAVGHTRLRLLEDRHRPLEVAVDAPRLPRRDGQHDETQEDEGREDAQDERANRMTGPRPPVALGETGRRRRPALPGVTEGASSPPVDGTETGSSTRTEVGGPCCGPRGVVTGFEYTGGLLPSRQAASSGRFLHLQAWPGQSSPQNSSRIVWSSAEVDPCSPPARTGSSSTGRGRFGEHHRRLGDRRGDRDRRGRLRGGPRASTARRTSCRTASAWPWIRAARFFRNSRSRAMYSPPISAAAAGGGAGRRRRGLRGGGHLLAKALVLGVHARQLLGHPVEELVHLALVVAAEARLAAEDLLLDLQRRHPLLWRLLGFAHLGSILLLPHGRSLPLWCLVRSFFLPVPAHNHNPPCGQGYASDDRITWITMKTRIGERSSAIIPRRTGGISLRTGLRTGSVTSTSRLYTVRMGPETGGGNHVDSRRAIRISSYTNRSVERSPFMRGEP